MNHKKIFILAHIYLALCVAFATVIYGKIVEFKSDMRDEDNRVLLQISRICAGDVLEFERSGEMLKAKCK